MRLRKKIKRSLYDINYQNVIDPKQFCNPSSYLEEFAFVVFRTTSHALGHIFRPRLSSKTYAKIESCIVLHVFIALFKSTQCEPMLSVCRAKFILIDRFIMIS